MWSSTLVLELDDVVIAVGTAHEMTLRTAAHPADVLNGLGWHGGVPIDSGAHYQLRSAFLKEAGLGLALIDEIRLAVSFIRGPL